MIAEELRTASSALLFEFLKEIGQSPGIIARLVHDDRAYRVGLCFIASRVFHHQSTGPQLYTYTSEVAHSPSAEKSSQRTQKARPLCFRRLLRRMLHVNVRHFMSHHACQFRFILGRDNRTDIDEHRAAWQSKGIDILLRNYVELERPRVFLGDDIRQLFP